MCNHLMLKYLSIWINGLLEYWSDVGDSINPLVSTP